MQVNRFKYSESTNLIFLSGNGSGFVKSDLEIPAPSETVVPYLLFSIGFKGGELIKSGITQEVVLTLLAAILMACFVPIYTFFLCSSA